MILQQFNGQRVHVLAKTMHREEKIMQGSERNERDANTKSKGKSAANTKSKGKSAKSAQTCLEDLGGKMPRPKAGTGVWCELAQSKCTWTSHKSNSTRKFRGKMRGADGAP